FRACSCTPTVAVAMTIVRQEGTSGSPSTATRLRRGKTSLSNSRRLPDVSGERLASPVTLPPGRLRLATNPCMTGSPLTVITMGRVFVTWRAGSIAAESPATMISTRRWSNSVARSGSLARSPPATRLSIRRFWPSIHPTSSSPCKNEELGGEFRASQPILRGLSFCCAFAAGGPRTTLRMSTTASPIRRKGHLGEDGWAESSRRELLAAGGSVQRGPADEIRVPVLRQGPAPERDAARAGHSQPVAVRSRRRRVARHLAVRAVGVDERLKVGQQGRRHALGFVTGATFSGLRRKVAARAR